MSSGRGIAVEMVTTEVRKSKAIRIRLSELEEGYIVVLSSWQYAEKLLCDEQ